MLEKKLSPNYTPKIRKSNEEKNEKAKKEKKDLKPDLTLPKP
jgi:hypothetical protein